MNTHKTHKVPIQIVLISTIYCCPKPSCVSPQNPVIIFNKPCYDTPATFPSNETVRTFLADFAQKASLVRVPGSVSRGRDSD